MSTLAPPAHFFVVAGLLEIGGAYMMWLWLRERWACWAGALGALVLVVYGVVPTFQPANFGRVYTGRVAQPLCSTNAGLINIQVSVRGNV